MPKKAKGLPTIRLLCLAAAVGAACAAPATGQVVVKVNEDVNFRFGALLQAWGDWTQDANTSGYSQNFFLRRVRFILLANVAPGVSVFYQTDNARLGNAGATGIKNFNTGPALINNATNVGIKITKILCAADG